MKKDPPLVIDTLGFEDYTRFPNLLAGIEKRGYSAPDIERLAGQNFLGVFRNVVG
jgi:microsomal dipeptidase-like Zn-dependent dipeptidase